MFVDDVNAKKGNASLILIHFGSEKYEIHVYGLRMKELINE